MNENVFVSHAFGLLTAAVIVTAGAFLWITVKASSLHIIKTRMWRLAAGGHQHRFDPMLADAIRDATQLAAFRFHFLPGVAHWPEAQSTLRWARERSIDMTSLAACGGWFDRHKRVVNAPLFGCRFAEAIYGLVRGDEMGARRTHKIAGDRTRTERYTRQRHSSGRVGGERMDRVIAARAKSLGVSVAEMRDEYLEKISLRRMVTVDDISATALFLASAAARNITGQAISVDGNVEYL
jgi:hypothetical protein